MPQEVAKDEIVLSEDTQPQVQQAHTDTGEPARVYLEAYTGADEYKVVPRNAQ